MPDATRTADIAAPPSAVFALVTDAARMPEWLPLCTRAQVVTDGPLAVGSRIRAHYSQGGHDGDLDGVVTELVTDRRLVETFHDDLFDLHATFDLVPGPDDATTHLTQTLDVHTKGLRGRLLSPLIARELPAQADRAIAAIGRLATG